MSNPYSIIEINPLTTKKVERLIEVLAYDLKVEVSFLPEDDHIVQIKIRGGTLEERAVICKLLFMRKGFVANPSAEPLTITAWVISVYYNLLDLEEFETRDALELMASERVSG